jgi:hypothetical protein
MTHHSHKKAALCFAVGFAVIAAGLPQLRLRAQSVPLPTAKEIVAKYDQALGGEDAIRRHTSSTMRGTGEVPSPTGPVTLPFIFYAGAPYLRLERTALPSHQGDVLNGFDGQLAWGYDPRSGPVIATGDDRESAKRDADFYYPLDELTWFKSMETAGLEEFEGQHCYHLHGINNWNKSNDHFYDAQTGLLAGYEFEADMPDGPALIHEIFSDYRNVDGVLVPMKQTVKFKPKKGGAWTVAQVLTFRSVTFNDVDPTTFVPPQAVRDLAAKPH